MHWLSRGLLLLGVVVVLGLVAVPQAFGADTATSDVAIIRKGVVIEDDLYVSGLSIIIDGEVHGDVIAFAAEDIVISGLVTGSVFAVAQEVTVSGQVVQSVRAAASRVTVTGNVGKDLVVAAARVHVGPDAEIDGDILIWSFGADLAGKIGRDLSGTLGTLSLSGQIGRNVDLTVSRLDLTGATTVGGDLSYRSRRVATGLANVDARGVVVHETPLAPNVRVRALGLLGRMLIVLGLTASAILVAYGWPERVDRAAKRGWGSPLKAYGIGFLILISPLVVLAVGALIVSLAPAGLSLPLLVVVIPLALALAGMVLAFSMVAGAPAVLSLGRRLRPGTGLYRAIGIGATVLGLVWLLPVVGWLVPILALPLGMGSWVLATRPERESVETEPVASSS